METFEARVKQDGDHHHLELDCISEKILITLTEDRPIDVKESFNKLLLLLKKKDFRFEARRVSGKMSPVDSRVGYGFVEGQADGGRHPEGQPT